MAACALHHITSRLRRMAEVIDMSSLLEQGLGVHVPYIQVAAPQVQHA